jgi:hypothetical protein
LSRRDLHVPRAKQEVVFEYSVRFPKELIVAGIE